MEEKKLFLIDAYAMIYRAYYALVRTPRVTSDGRNTSAIFGFCNAMADVIRKENPQYMAVCFDPAGPTFRHEQYPEYKAQRDKQPEDITFAIPYIKDIIRANGVQVVEVQRYEADDIIGTLATQAAKEGFTTYMMTPDKDYGQLVAPNIYMYRPALKGQGFEVRGVREVCERYGIDSPRQVIDILALEGDVSDNIPGCPGVGKVTAEKLVKQFGSIENMLAHTDEIKGKLREKVEENAAQIEFSKQLVTICTDAPVDVKPADLLRREPDIQSLRKIYTDLEFKSFINRLDAKPANEAVPAPSEPADGFAGSLFDLPEPAALNDTNVNAPDTAILTTPAQVAEFFGNVSTDLLALAVHADGDEAMTANLRGIAIAVRDKTPVYIPCNDKIATEMAEVLQPLFNNHGVRVASHDVKRDMIILRRSDIDITAPYFDTALAHYVLKPDMKHDLADLAMQFNGDLLAEYRMSALDRKRPAKGTPEQLARRFAARAQAVLKLVPRLEDALEQDGTAALLHDIELPMVRVLAGMEWTGVRIDVAELQTLSKEMTAQLTALEEQCYQLAGERFNIGSPSQVGEILFGKLGLDPKAKRTKSGTYSTTEEILLKYRTKSPLVELILEIRGLKKLLSTYVDALPKLVNPHTGHIHTTYNQTVTATGRLSSTNPNLQNIPIRTDQGREIRRAFVPDSGCVMLSADYSQIELRLMAAVSGDPVMIDAFNSGADIHRATAARIYHIPLEQVTDNQRRNAKTANFGIIYGISAFGLSERLGIPRNEAKELIQGYLRTYPDVQQYMNNAIEDARSKGYVSTVKGRKRYLPEIGSRNAALRGYAERNAINAPLQGSAADIIKIAMVDIDAEISRRGFRARMILQVHDELVFNVPTDELDEVRQLVVEKMENAWHGPVPLTVSAGVGANWLEAH